MRPATLLLPFALALPFAVSAACGGSSSTDDATTASAGGASGAGANAGTSSGKGGNGTGGGTGGNGTAGNGTGGLDGGTSGTTGSSGTAGASGASGASGAGGALVGVDGGACGTTACTDCLDNDGDGLVDGFDPDCTGYLDNDEGSFATGIPGDNIDPCKQDCFFDGNSGAGDDKCNWDLACDPANPGKNQGCPYDPNKKNCPGPQSAACIANCMAKVPNGCDCFGCCAFQTPSGPKSVLLLPTCTYASIDDPTKCPPCTQVPSCLNTCETCELCLGKNELPPECTTGAGGSTGTGGGSGTGGSGTGGDPGTGGSAGTTGTAGSGGTIAIPLCPSAVEACTPTQPCADPSSYYCLTGCCVKIVK